MVAELPLLVTAVARRFTVAGAADIRGEADTRGTVWRAVWRMVCVGIILRAVAVLALDIRQARRVRHLNQHFLPRAGNVAAGLVVGQEIHKGGIARCVVDTPGVFPRALAVEAITNCVTGKAILAEVAVGGNPLGKGLGMAGQAPGIEVGRGRAAYPVAAGAVLVSDRSSVAVKDRIQRQYRVDHAMVATGVHLDDRAGIRLFNLVGADDIGCEPRRLRRPTGSALRLIQPGRC